MIKRISKIMMIVLFLMLAEMQCFASEISEEKLTNVENRLATALENYEQTVDVRDLEIQVNMYADRLSPEYESLLKLSEKVVEKHGSFSLGEHKIPYCTVSFSTEPSEGNTDPYQIGENDVTEMILTYDTNYCPMMEKPDAELFEEIKKVSSENYQHALECVDDDMSDVEKALVLYDYIVSVSNYPEGIGYDEEGVELFENKHYSEVNLFYEGVSVCMANANAYARLLSDVGIEAITVDSEEMNHEWTMLKLDGNWYHADPTWDDPRHYDVTLLGDYNEDAWDLGAVRHDYFLKSDEEIMELNHYGWNLAKNYSRNEISGLPKADVSGAWNDYFFAENTQGGNVSRFNYIDGTWYFLDFLQSRIITFENGEYFYPDFGPNIKYVQGDGEKLFICRENSIEYFVPAEEKTETILSTESYGEGAVISEMRVVNGKLEAVILIPDDSEGGLISHDYSSEVTSLVKVPDDTMQEDIEKDDVVQNDAEVPEQKESMILYILPAVGAVLIVIIGMAMKRKKND